MGNPGRDGPAPKSGAPRSPRPTPLAEILHDRLAAHAYPCTREAVRQFAVSLLAAAREAVAACPWLRPAQPAASADEMAGTALVLAVLAERQAGPKRIALGDARPPQVRRLCKACRTAAALIKAAAAGLGWSAADLAADSSRFESAEQLAADFERALGVRHSRSLARRPDRLSARVAAWAANRQRSDNDVRSHAQEVLAAAWTPIHAVLARPMTDQQKDAWIEQCVAAFEVPHLRTCPDELLAQMGVNFAQWRPLVRYLEARAGCRQDADPAIEIELQTLIRRLTLTLCKHCPQENRRPAIEDAVACMIAKSLEEIRASCWGYRYEGSLLGWAVKGAVRLLAGRPAGRRMREFTVASDDEKQTGLAGVPSPPSRDRTLEYFDFLFSFQERCRIVRSFSRGDAGLRLRDWLEAVLRDAADDPDALSTALAGEALRPPADPLPELRADTSPDLDATTLRRLRQRLETLNYIRNEVPDGMPDEPGDLSVLEWVASTYGLDALDVPTIRGLANLARAAAQEGILTWVYLARLFVDKCRPVHDIREEGLSLIRGWCEVHTGDADQMLRRLTALCDLMGKSLRNGRLAEVRRQVMRQCTEAKKRRRQEAPGRSPQDGPPEGAASGGHAPAWWAPEVLRVPCYGYWIAPAWHLKVARGKSLDEVLRLLRPAEHQRAALEEIYEAL